MAGVPALRQECRRKCREWEALQSSWREALDAGLRGARISGLKPVVAGDGQGRGLGRRCRRAAE